MQHHNEQASSAANAMTTMRPPSRACARTALTTNRPIVTAIAQNTNTNHNAGICASTNLLRHLVEDTAAIFAEIWKSPCFHLSMLS